MPNPATTVWLRYAPEGAEWAKPTTAKGDYGQGMTSIKVEAALLARAEDLYWKRRPDPRAGCPAETVTPDL